MKEERESAILDLVVLDLNKRDEKGQRAYGTQLRALNGRDALQDLSEELLDAVMYTKQLRVELRWLGEQLRELHAQLEELDRAGIEDVAAPAAFLESLIDSLPPLEEPK